VSFSLSFTCIARRPGRAADSLISVATLAGATSLTRPVGSISVNYVKYDGRFINKLQNDDDDDDILSIFKLRKIRNMCFVGNLIGNMY